jgi:hypothetical protein
VPCPAGVRLVTNFQSGYPEILLDVRPDVCQGEDMQTKPTRPARMLQAMPAEYLGAQKVAMDAKVANGTATQLDLDFLRAVEEELAIRSGH